jgi:hypothetical protein
MTLLLAQGRTPSISARRSPAADQSHPAAAREWLAAADGDGDIDLRA